MLIWRSCPSFPEHNNASIVSVRGRYSAPWLPIMTVYIKPLDFEMYLHFFRNYMQLAQSILYLSVLCWCSCNFRSINAKVYLGLQSSAVVSVHRPLIVVFNVQICARMTVPQIYGRCECACVNAVFVLVITNLNGMFSRKNCKCHGHC